MHLETLDEWFADLPDELIHIVMEYCDARSLATLSATASWLSPPAHEWATKKAMERGYAFAPGSKVTAGRLAVLESRGRRSLGTYINALGERRFVVRRQLSTSCSVLILWYWSARAPCRRYEFASQRTQVEFHMHVSRLACLCPLLLRSIRHPRLRARAVSHPGPGLSLVHLYLLPCLGQSPLWEAHAADIASVYNDSDPGVRGAAGAA